MRISEYYLFYCDIRIKSSILSHKIYEGQWGAKPMKPRKYMPGDKNIIGVKVVAIRKAKHIKQKDFLSKLQTMGMDISATSLSRLEGQYRLVQDFEVVIIAEALEITVQELLGKGRDR
jgi:HTH-type transcriptional regulator, cell division transcriptional repressor